MRVFTATVVGEAGRVTNVVVARPISAQAPLVAPSPAVAEHASSSPRPREGANRTLAYGALGVGAAGLVVGSLGALFVLSAKSTVGGHCDTAARTCDAEGLDATSRGRTWSTVSPIAFGVGALGLGAGAFLLLRRAQGGSLSVAPNVGAGSAGVALGGVL
jgi:hypothetical protein